MIKDYCIIAEVGPYGEKFYRRTFFIAVLLPRGTF